MQITKTYNKYIYGDLIGDIRRLIETARQNVAVRVNAGLTTLYWQIGDRIRQDILKKKRAEYGREIIVTVSRQLAVEYGRGFSQRNLFNMIRFAEVFPDERIVHALSAQLTWTHFKEIIVTTRVGRLKTVRKNGNTAHFEAMFGAKTCSLSTNVRQSCFSDPFSLNSFSLST